jgi:transcriptional regulator with XRE-family HTH domain
MEEKKDRMDVLLKSLIKMGELPPEDKIIDYLMDLPSVREIPKAVREKTIAKLEKRQKELRDTKKRLQNPAKLNSFGEYIRLIRIKEKFDTSDLATRAKIATNKINLLENDSISPLDFTLDEMARLIRSIGLTAQIAIGLIRKSHQLFKMQPQIAEASARYDDKHGIPESKIGDMDRALKELMLKSSFRKTEPLVDPALANYLKDLQDKLK